MTRIQASAWVILGALTAACSRDAPPAPDPRAGHGPSQVTPDDPGSAVPNDPYQTLRDAMVAEQIAARDVRDTRVLAAMRKVPRHEFVPAAYRELSYYDRPLPIGFEQTISQPYVVAVMTELAALDQHSSVLEIGTGSGYQAAVLAEIADQVYSIEIVRPLAERTAEDLSRLGYQRIHLRIGDGYMGWPEAAPFDAIVVTAAPPRVPRPLLEQLRVGGRMVIPVGDFYQELTVITRTESGYTERTVFPVRFVPMTGAAQER